MAHEVDLGIVCNKWLLSYLTGILTIERFGFTGVPGRPFALLQLLYSGVNFAKLS